MAIDTRQSRAGKYSRNKYYKGKYVDKMALVKDAVVQGVFYSVDYEPFKKSSVTSGSIKHKSVIGKILTEDYIPDLDVDDYVLYEGELYRVRAIDGADTNENKQFSTRPSYKRIITIVR